MENFGICNKSAGCDICEDSTAVLKSMRLAYCSDKVDKVADDVDKRVTDIDSVVKMMKNLYELETVNKVKAEVDKIADMSAKTTELVR